MKISVYIADDHTVVRDGLRALLLAHPDVQVVGDAASGRLAIRQVAELHPDVVIMDVSMPDLSGIESTRQIVRDNPDIRVIILSMLGSSEHIFHALQAGAQGYLLKESAGREVIEAIKTVYLGRRYFSQPVLETLMADYLDAKKVASKKNPLETLSERERQVLEMVIEGKTSAEIAEILFLSPKTVESYRSRMMHKLGVEDVPGLIKFAIQQGLIS